MAFNGSDTHALVVMVNQQSVAVMKKDTRESEKQKKQNQQ